ncbi:MAG: secretin N-terminal domain-containing protein [Chlamydiota bacterium]
MAFHEKIEDGYKINYNNVSLTEYIRFVSKVAGINFIFNEEELNMTVTVTSETPLSTENILGTLVQLLRIRGFQLLQEENNVVIHQNPDVQQAANLFFPEDGLDRNYPLTTAVFKISNEEASRIADIIRPMISSGAQLEVLNATNQIILSDVTENVETLKKLIEHLDTINRSVAIELYQIKNSNPKFLIDMTKEILQPMVAKHPFFLTHPLSSPYLYIVSQPALIEKALDVLRQLDQEVAGQGFPDVNNVLLYSAKYQPAQALLDAAAYLADSIEKSGYQSKGIVQALRAGKRVGESKSLLFTGQQEILKSIEEMLAVFDIPYERKSLQGENIFIYPLQNQTTEDLIPALRKVAQAMLDAGYDEQGLISTIEACIPMENNRSILFIGMPSSFAKIQEIVEDLDIPTKEAERLEKNSFFLYRPIHVSPQKIYHTFQEIFEHLQKSPIDRQDLYEIRDRVSIVRGSGSLLFTGDSALFPKIREILATIDIPPSVEKDNQFLSYRPQVLTGEEIFKSMEDYGKKLSASGFSDPDVLTAIEGMKWIPSTSTLLFTGTPSSLEKIGVLLETIDHPTTAGDSQTTFLLYSLQHVSKESFEEYLKNIGGKLHKQDLKEEQLLNAIDSMKWIQQSHSFLFTGTENALARVQEIAQSFDVPSVQREQPSFILYPIKTVSRKMVEAYLEQIASNLDQTNPKQDALYQAITSMKWIANSGSFMFSGLSTALDSLQKILQDYDQPSVGPGDGYFLYKLEYVQGDLIEKQLQHFAENMRSTSLRDTSILEVIENLKWIKATNSILLTGPSQAIEDVKDLVAQYDVSPGTSQEEVHNDFYMYKPQHLSPSTLQLSLEDIAKSLEEGGLVDEGLLGAIESMQYSAQTHALVFTGNSVALQKLATIIEEVDIPSAKHAAVQKIGRTTFLLYKLKNTSGNYIVNSLESVINDLKKSKNYDFELVRVLQNMKYIRETNSLLFTGPEEALEKAKNLVAKFDLPRVGQAEAPSQFFVYKPEYTSPEDLEGLLLNFADHLKETGLVDPELYNTLYSMKYVAATQSLIFTGTAESLERTRELLRTFDVPGEDSPPKMAEIQPIDNTSFLVYKLQYHPGSEIQGALKRISKDLLDTKNNTSQNLLDAIRSVQWLEITNSLLVTGDQETLTRLKELIKNLDVPLKQVFIEILAIQTTLTNLLDFGLEWGGKGNYRERFAYSTGNFAPIPSSGGDTFSTTLNGVNASNRPDPSNIPFTQPGFDLGVIGDMILHKGKSFFSLGSLLTALQSDSEVSILLTPKIITQDNRTSTLFVGQNIPFIGSILQNVNSSNTLFQNTNVEYRDIGLNLTITPVIGNSDIVSLSIDIENSVEVSNSSGDTITTVNSQAFSAVTTSKTNLSTTVHVPNESFLVLSGLVNATDSKSTSAVPCLGGLPFIGSAFSKLDRSKDVRNIVFFIRPRILHSRGDMRAISEEQEDFFREKAGTVRLEADFEESMESIKSINDD